MIQPCLAIYPAPSRLIGTMINRMMRMRDKLRKVAIDCLNVSVSVSRAARRPPPAQATGAGSAGGTHVVRVVLLDMGLEASKASSTRFWAKMQALQRRYQLSTTTFGLWPTQHAERSPEPVLQACKPARPLDAGEFEDALTLKVPVPATRALRPIASLASAVRLFLAQPPKAKWTIRHGCLPNRPWDLGLPPSSPQMSLTALHSSSLSRVKSQGHPGDLSLSRSAFCVLPSVPMAPLDGGPPFMLTRLVAFSPVNISAVPL